MINTGKIKFPFLPKNPVYINHYIGHDNANLNRLAANTSPGIGCPHPSKSAALADPNYVGFMRDYAHRIKDTKRGKRWRKPYKTVPCRLIATPNATESVDGSVKTRYALVYPLPELGIENQFIRPLLDHLATQPNYVINVALHREICKKNSYGLDISKSDTSLPAGLIEVALYVIRSHLSFDRYSTGEIPYSTNSLERLWQHYKRYILRTPVEVNGEITYFENGIPSGCLATNLLTSICGIILQALVHDEECPYSLRQYGDDSVLSLIHI